MRVDEARLRTYLDGELPEPERALLEEYLAAAPQARAALARLRRDKELVERALDRLNLSAADFSAARPAQPGPVSRPPSLAAWESPTLLGELKTFFQRPDFRPDRSKGVFSMSKQLLWLTGTGLMVAAIVAALLLRPDAGQRLAERVGEWWLLAGENSSVAGPGENEPLPAVVTVTHEPDPTPTGVISTSQVVVALQPISRGLEIAPGWVGRREWPAGSEPPGAITSEAGVIGRIARMDIIQGQVIVPDMLLAPAAEVNYELKDVRQLTPCENKGRHHLFVRVVDAAGRGLNGVPVKVRWQAGPEEYTVLRTETRDGQPGWLQFEMGDEGYYTVEVAAGASQAAAVNPAHFTAVELCNGEPGNAPGRGSYEIIFEQAEPVAVTAAAEPGFGYGIQVDPHGDTKANIGHVQALGFGWVKLRLPWKEVEPEPGRYSWQPWDEVINAYAAANIRVLLNIVHAPGWARPEDDDKSVEGLPLDPADYAAFVAKVTERYQGRVQAIEIWNEQNIWYKVGGRGKIDAAGYVQLLQPAYKAIKAVDRNVRVISGGLNPAGNAGDLAVDDFDYLQAMYDSGAKGYFDALGAQPAGFLCPALAGWRTVTPEEATADPRHGTFTGRHHSWCFLGTLEGYREILLANGDGDTPIWVTQFGWAVANTTIPGYEYARDNTPEEQAQWIIEAYNWAEEQDWVGPLFLWNLDYGVTAPGTELALFGILNTPAYDALAGRPR